MMKSKYKNLLIISLITIFSLMSIITAIMATNFIHTEKCHTSECPLCHLINLSSDFMKNIGLIGIDISILIVIIPLMQLINKNIEKVSELTLVELKVRQNK